MKQFDKDIIRPIKTFLLITAVFIILTSTLSATDRVCRSCGEQITDTYINAHGYYFHPEHFICAYCSEVIGSESSYFENGNFYHTDCYKKMNRLVCAYCGQLLEEKYVETGGKKYHNRCYVNHVALKCSLCSGVLNGPYVLDLKGHAYHADHVGNVPQCYYCKIFLGTGGIDGVEIPGSKYICSECRKTAVDTEDELKDLFIVVNQQLEEFGFDIDLDEVELHLSEQPELLSLYEAKPDKNLMGFTYIEKTESFFGFFKSRKIIIHLLNGMPYMWAVNAAAHELNHAWQFMLEDDDKDLDYCEGSACYSSYLVLQKYSDDPFARLLMQNLLEDEDRIYGEGFRRVKYIVDHNGLPYWKDHLAHNKSFPQGY